MHKPIPIVIVGAGGFGREALDVIMACNATGNRPSFELLGVVDSAPSEINLHRLAQMGVKYLGTENEWLSSGRRAHYVAGIGNPAVREIVCERFDSAGLPAATVVHPTACVGSLTQMAPGLVICAGVQVSTNVRFGRHVHLNPNATIGHDATFGDYVSINPGAIVSGDVVCQDRVLIGAGAVVLQGLTVGTGSTVGAAACVTKDVTGESIVRGVPAR